MNYLHLKPKNLYRKEAVRIALAFAIGMIIQRIFHIQHGFWVMFTIAIIYLAGAAHGYIMARINHRILGSFLGLILGTYMLSLFSFNSHYFLYVSPLFFFLAFYTYFITNNNYFYLSLFLSIYLLMIVGFTTPSDHTINLANLNFSRIFCTVLGTIILVFVETIIFPKSTRPKNTTTLLLENILTEYFYAVEIICKKYISRTEIENALIEKIATLASDTLDLENLAKAAGYELNFIEKYEPIYKKIIFHNNSILRTVKQLTYISNHYSHKKISTSNIIESIILELNKNNLLNQQEEKLTKRIARKLFCDHNIKNINNEEILFLKYIHRALNHTQQLHICIQLISKS